MFWLSLLLPFSYTWFPKEDVKPDRQELLLAGVQEILLIQGGILGVEPGKVSGNKSAVLLVYLDEMKAVIDNSAFDISPDDFAFCLKNMMKGKVYGCIDILAVIKPVGAHESHSAVGYVGNYREIGQVIPFRFEICRQIGIVSGGKPCIDNFFRIGDLNGHIAGMSSIDRMDDAAEQINKKFIKKPNGDMRAGDDDILQITVD